MAEESLLPSHTEDVSASPNKSSSLLSEISNASTRPFVLAFTVGSCGALSFGCIVGYTAPTQSSIMKDLNLSIADFSFFGSILTVGLILGALICGKLADLVGRVYTIWITNILVLIGWLAIAFAKDVRLLDLGRLLQGISVGISSYLGPIYISELAPRNLRGAASSLMQLFVGVGLSALVNHQPLPPASSSFHSSSFLDCKPPASTSHGWRGICIGKDLLKQHLGKVIGDGKQISLWNVPWMSLQSSTIAMGPPPEASHSWTVSQLISTDTLEWDREKIKQTLPEFESEILEIRLSKLGAKDTFVWLPAKNGSYSASSGYYASIVKEPAPSFFAAPTADFNWTKEIWKVNTSQKTKNFMWKAMRGALPTGENLRRRGINAEARCPFCGEEESTFHLFFTCSFAPTAIGAGTILPWLLWSIWISRNQRIFKDRHSSPIETLNRALSTSREWLLAQEALRTTPRQVNFVHHRSALPTTVTCHTDAAWNRDNKMAGIGWIFNSDKKEIAKIGFGSSRHVRSPLLGEALAIHEALSHASSLGFSNLIEVINSEDPPMELHGSPQYPATIL